MDFMGVPPVASDYCTPRVSSNPRSGSLGSGGRCGEVLFEKSGPLARVTINRPERMNACDFETYRLLGEAWPEVDRDPEIRVAILTGAGERAFCAGSYIKSDYVDSGSGRHAAAAREEGAERLPGLVDAKL